MIGIRMKFAGMAQEQFDKVNDIVDPGSDPPKGLVFHSSGPVDGGWGVLDFWESREEFDAFGARIRSAAEAAGVEWQGPPDTKEFPVHETYSR